MWSSNPPLGGWEEETHCRTRLAKMLGTHCHGISVYLWCILMIHDKLLYCDVLCLIYNRRFVYVLFMFLTLLILLMSCHPFFLPQEVKFLAWMRTWGSRAVQTMTSTLGSFVSQRVGKNHPGTNWKQTNTFRIHIIYNNNNNNNNILLLLLWLLYIYMLLE